VLAVSEKIVMRTADLASWIVEPDEWHYGSALLAPPVSITYLNILFIRWASCQCLLLTTTFRIFKGIIRSKSHCLK